MSEDKEQFEAWLNSDISFNSLDSDMINYFHGNREKLFVGFQACAKIKDAKYAKLRELAEKVATAGYYTHSLSTAMDELRNYLKEVK